MQSAGSIEFLSEAGSENFAARITETSGAENIADLKYVGVEMAEEISCQSEG